MKTAITNQAQRLAAKLNKYLSQDCWDWDNPENHWQDVVASSDYDEERSEAGDGSIVYMQDGSILRWQEQEEEWVADA